MNASDKIALGNLLLTEIVEQMDLWRRKMVKMFTFTPYERGSKSSYMMSSMETCTGWCTISQSILASERSIFLKVEMKSERSTQIVSCTELQIEWELQQETCSAYRTCSTRWKYSSN
jgi:hypothetical protein